MRRRLRPLVLPALVVSAMLVRLVLVSSRHVAPFLDGAYDDQLFARQAATILEGNWLGPYDHLTLAKGPGYPLFIALSHQLHLRLPLAEALFWCAACGLTLVAVLSFGFSRPAGYVAFLFLSFHPIPYAAVFDRLVRERFSTTLTLVVLASGIGLLSAVRGNLARRTWTWGLVHGLSFGWLSITREETLWLMPSLAILWIWLLVSCAREPGGIFRRTARLVPLVGVVITAAAPVLLVRLLNAQKYGVGIVSELADASFPAAFGSLTRVIPPAGSNPKVAVSAQSRALIYENSPAFRELKATLDEPSFWREPTCLFYPEVCGDIATGWFLWALRDAASLVGYHADAHTAERFYDRLASEVNDACARGAMTCLPPRRTLQPPLLRAHLRLLPHALWQGALIMVMADRSPWVRQLPTFGGPTNVGLFMHVTRDTLGPEGTTLTGVSGSLIGPHDRVTIEVTSDIEAGSFGRLTWHTDAAPGSRSSGAAVDRFEWRGICLMPCRLRFSDDGLRVADEELETRTAMPLHLRRADAAELGSVERVEASEPSLGRSTQARRTRLDELKEMPLVALAWSYHVFLAPLVVISLAIYLVLTVRVFSAGSRFDEWIGATAFLAAAASRLLAVSLVDVSSFPCVGIGYLAPGMIALALFAIWLALVVTARPSG